MNKAQKYIMAVVVISLMGCGGDGSIKQDISYQYNLDQSFYNVAGEMPKQLEGYFYKIEFNSTSQLFEFILVQFIRLPETKDEDGEIQHPYKIIRYEDSGRYKQEVVIPAYFLPSNKAGAVNPEYFCYSQGDNYERDNGYVSQLTCYLPSSVGVLYQLQDFPVQKIKVPADFLSPDDIKSGEMPLDKLDINQLVQRMLQNNSRKELIGKQGSRLFSYRYSKNLAGLSVRDFIAQQKKIILALHPGLKF